VTQPKEGDLRVWWIPQVPMPAFEVPVESRSQGWWLVEVLARYDEFQFVHNVKPDYSNAGGVQEYLKIDGEYDWYDVDEDEE